MENDPYSIDVDRLVQEDKEKGFTHGFVRCPPSRLVSYKKRMHYSYGTRDSNEKSILRSIGTVIGVCARVRTVVQGIGLY